jgi:O-antigen ligase
VRAALALIVLGFIPGLLDPFAPAKAVAMRVIGLTLLVVNATSQRFAQRGSNGVRGPAFPAARALDCAVLAWCVVAMLSAVFGVSPHLSLVGEPQQREGLLTTLALAGLYSGARSSHRNAIDRRRTLDTLVVTAALAAGYAMVQRSGLDPLPWADRAGYAFTTGNVFRPFGTLGNPILLGAVLAAALAVVIARLLVEREHRASSIALAALLTTTLAATLSRGDWLGAVVGSLVAFYGVRFVPEAPPPRMRLGLALLIVAITLTWTALALRAPVAARLQESVSAVSSHARVEIARAALAIGQAHPLLGSGPDTFALGFPAVRSAEFWRQEWLGMPAQAHSVPLQVLATLGALGALAGVAWLAAIALALVAAARRRSAPRGEVLALAAAGVALGVAGLFNAVGLAGAAAFVVISALAAAIVREDTPTPTRSRSSRTAALLASLVTACVVAGLGARELTSFADAGRVRGLFDRSIEESGDARDRTYAEAALFAARATQLQPGEDLLWLMQSDVALARCERALARADLVAGAAAAHEATDAALRARRLVPARATGAQRLGSAWTMQARVNLATSETLAAARAEVSAARAFADARSLAPTDALILVEEARGQLSLQRWSEALVSARAIVALYPEAANGYTLESAALLGLGRVAEARTALARAQAARWEEGDDARRAEVERLLRELPETRPDH